MKASPLVMIVDGDEIHREMLENMLEDTVDVLNIANAQVCLESLEYKKPDLIIIDPKDPAIDGWNLIRKIREQIEENAASIIVLTEEANFDTRLKSYELGANDFLAKPFQPEEFLNKVQLNLNAKQYYRRLREEAMDAMATAMAALKQCSDLGLILRFMEDAIKAETHGSLANVLKEYLEQFGIDISLMILSDHQPHYYFCDEDSQASVLMAMCREKGRIVDIGLVTVVNGTDVSIFVREMPKDETRYGEVKDAISIMSNLADNRARFISSMAALKREQEFGVQASVLRGIQRITQMQQQIEGHVEQIDRGVSGLKVHINESLVAIGVTEEQENMFTDLLSDYLDRMEEGFAGIIKLEQDLKALTAELSSMVNK